MSKRCIIIGAGASYGYDSKLINSQKPPLGKDVLSRALERGILVKEKFPCILESLVDYCEKHQKDNVYFSDVDIEEFLESMATKLESISSTLNLSAPTATSTDIEKITAEIQKDFANSWKIIKSSYNDGADLNRDLRKAAYFFQSALGESWFLMFDLFRDYSIAYRPAFDAYQRLALQHLKEDYDLISLNYDVLFELAANASGIAVRYPDTNPDKLLLTNSRIISVAKVHGSVNWFNSYSRTITLGDTNETSYKLLNKVAGFIYSNRSQMEPIRIVEPALLRQITMDNILQSGREYYEPALLPPIGGYKDYDKVRYFKLNWTEAERMIGLADELVFIGTQVRKQDTMLREMLKNKAKAKVDILTVGSKPTERDLKEIMGDKVGTVSAFVDFEEFAKTL